MPRGRKKQEGSKTEVISIRITKDQKELIKKNNWIKKDIDKMVREHLNAFL